MFGKPTQMSEARENLRDGNVGDAVSGALGAMRETQEAAPLYVAINDDDFGKRPVELLNARCPFMNGEALDPDVFDIELFETVTGGSTLKLGLTALLGTMRQTEEVEHIKAHRFRLRADYPIRGLLDGEPHEFEGDVTVELDRESGLVLAPHPSMSFATTRPQETPA